jgi:hypothetical protein
MDVRGACLFYELIINNPEQKILIDISLALWYVESEWSVEKGALILPIVAVYRCCYYIRHRKW